MTSIYQKFRQVAKDNAKRNAVFYSDNKKTYQEILQSVDSFSAGLITLKVRAGDRVAIMSENRPEWLISDLSINKLGAVSVPIHSTANKEFINHVLLDSSSSLIVVSDSVFSKNMDLLKSIKSLKVIVVGRVDISNLENYYTFADILEINKDVLDFKESNTSIASIIYTSGTTGLPKGVMLTNKNFLSNALSASQEFNVTSSDKFLSFLPLSHVLERTLGSYIPILNGCSIFYSQGIKHIKEELRVARPTVFISVPKIFERFYEGIRDNANTGGVTKKKIFYWALKNKHSLLADILVFKKIRNLFGGNIRFCVSGGASLNPQVLKFFKNAHILISEGYGLTETSPIVSANKLNKICPGSVGQPISGVEIRISDTKEILVKGSNVMQGYWRQEKKTEAVFDKQGWFKTGDLGYIDSEGVLTIIGRAKDIIVTSNGKNISPEKLEGIINLSPFVMQAIVVGHKQSKIAALIVADKSNIREKEEKQIVNIIQKEIELINKKLEAHEWIRNFIVINKPFTQETGELTPTLKLKRFVIEDKYKKEIKELFMK